MGRAALGVPHRHYSGQTDKRLRGQCSGFATLLRSLAVGHPTIIDITASVGHSNMSEILEAREFAGVLRSSE